uniref:Putative major fimbrial structural subunit n=1 Tax=Bordetella parapertussis TaxID=519 RepID=O52154_BORPP|nr:putative major fimbrial structural subunit [Bordetella parapertussis]
MNLKFAGIALGPDRLCIDIPASGFRGGRHARDYRRHHRYDVQDQWRGASHQHNGAIADHFAHRAQGRRVDGRRDSF